ncbi:MAG: sensor domain-containing phosphodiesterase [Alphaproteobacteria bacterium]|nr:sensor domain-containing phosphodiesterase [Alphaproteobacteria bacterium]
MIRSINPRLIFASVCAATILALLCVAGANGLRAESILDVTAESNQVDLAKFRNAIAAERPDISLQGPGDASVTPLKAKGPGPTFYWSLYSFRNTSDQPLNLVVEFDTQKFVGSGYLDIKNLSNPVLGVSATGGQTFTQQSSVLSDAISFEVKPKQIFNIAVEGSTIELQATLWQEQIWAQRQAQISFFNGLVFGVALLVSFGVLAIYGFRPHPAFISAAAFALAALLFIAFESGHLRLPPGLISNDAPTENHLRAIIESLMAAGLALCCLNFTRISKSSPVLGFIFLFLAGLMLANIAFAFAEPLRAVTVARSCFVLLVIMGTSVTVWLRKKTVDLVDPDIVFWISIIIWTIFAGTVLLLPNPVNVLSPVLQGALAATLVVMMTVLLKFLFSQGLNSKPFITDSSRRSLALSSAGHSMWEWLPDRNTLSIGEDLPRSLGLNGPAWVAQTQNSFIQVLHPQDVPNYLSVIESKDRRPGQMVLRELRLRAADGAYRWYLLRARWLLGPGQKLDRCIGTLTDITKDKQAEERLSVDAVQDSVTGLPNRILFIDRVERELKKTLGLPFRVLLVDIDRMKTLNDALGHEFGDMILKIAGTRISDCIESDETVARVSGSQFAVLAVDAIARRNVKALATKIMQALSQPMALRQQDIVLMASIGISAVNGAETSSALMMQQATTALLEAQQGGGSKAVEFHEELTDNRAAELSLESDLRRAISNDEIEVHYQPISYLNTLEVAGFEALARWRHPTQGLLPPLQFIELAEKAGLIAEIGQIVLSIAARQLGIWQRVLRRDKFFFIGVNISANHLMDPNFVKQVSDAINRETLSLGSLKIEVTESVIMRQPQKAAKILQQLRSLGVGLACDDFGTGFSSLSSLRDFPFDTLKIDRSFIDPDSYDERSATVITTITDLAHRLNMVVVAEGIETQDQIDNLAVLNVDLGQGYLIGQPMTSADVADLLRNFPNVPASAPASLYDPPHGVAILSDDRMAIDTRSVSPLRKNMPQLADDEVDEEDDEPELLPSIFAVPKAGVQKAKLPPAKKIIRKSTKKPTKKAVKASKKKSR